MKEKGIEIIARELCDLLDQQMKTISGPNLLQLTGEELQAYKLRQARISTLRHQLVAFELPN